MKHIARILGNNRGSVLIMTAVAIMGLLAFAVLAIDGSMMMTTKNQLQSAADAAALAGASALINGSQDEAIDRAIAYASFNLATQDTQKPVIITASDITFPESDVIRVTTHRTVETGDPLRTFFMKVVDLGTNNLSDVTAVAAAKAYDVCSSSCVKPWAIPDRWDDANANGAFDAGENYDADVTGYVAPNDVGLSVVLKVGTPQSTIAPGQFYPVQLPPLNCDCGATPEPGADAYRENIAGCNPYIVRPGDQLVTETGNMVGPTKQGVQELIDRDPGAHWNGATQTVEGSNFPMSPRVVLVPFFDPRIASQSGKSVVNVVKIGAFFIEDVMGNSQVTGRFMKVTVQGKPCTGGNGNSFLTGITLVE